VIITALRDANGELRGFGKVTRDITLRKEEQAQREEGSGSSPLGRCRSSGSWQPSTASSWPKASRSRSGPTAGGSRRSSPICSTTPSSTHQPAAFDLASSGAHAFLRVRDHGIGMRPEDMGRLFTRLGRLVTEENRNITGTGLGLFLCREIAHRHGGEILVESSPGAGSRFTLSLPRTEVEPPLSA
jgi:signal transduction histidine kinase